MIIIFPSTYQGLQTPHVMTQPTFWPSLQRKQNGLRFQAFDK